MKELTNNDKREIFKRLVKVRSKAIKDFPFWGTLMLKLKFSLADCGTAATDMHRILFDPSFICRISDMELEFIMLHETMHCALLHCIRGRGKHKQLYNIATDIVINSCLIKDIHERTGHHEKFLVDGEEPIHLAPNSKEGRKYNADQVYEMLLQELKNTGTTLTLDLDEEYGQTIDDHGIWEVTQTELSAEEEWKDAVYKASCGVYSGAEVPEIVRKLLKDIDYDGKLNWKEILHEFIKIISEKYDYTYAPPDRRYSDSDFVLPAFNPIGEVSVDNLWFVVDTSGSISEEQLTMLYKEIYCAMFQFEHLTGKISFFDTRVTEPIDFCTVEEIMYIVPKGGGGTRFGCIFDYMRDNMQDNLPEAVIVMTDGYSPYPQEDEALGIPVLWIIVGNDMEAPWGTTTHM